jgi:hypothetical protein
MTMTAHILHKEEDQVLEVSYEAPRQLEWVVQEDPKLESELNRLKAKKLTPKVVNKVLDRIKDL